MGEYILIILGVLILTGYPVGLAAQNPLTGTVEEPALGLSFTVPDEWTAYKTGNGYLIGSDTQKGFVLIMQNEYRSIEDLKSEAMEGIADENGTALYPEKPFEPFTENGIQLYLSGQIEWQLVEAYAIGLISPYDVGITILTAVEPTSFSQEYIDRLQKLARDISFKKPVVPPVIEEWKSALNGMRLTYMNTYSSGSSGGYSDKIQIDLCPGQIFKYSDRSSMSLDVDGGYAYSHGQNNGDGMWEIISIGEQPVLRLNFHDGSNRQYTISTQGNDFYLDNRRYFRTREANCNY